VLLKEQLQMIVTIYNTRLQQWLSDVSMV